MLMSPIAPSPMRLKSSPRASQWRHIRPTPTLRFFFFASSLRANIRRVEGPSGVSGFSMKTLTPFSMAFLKCTQRKAQGLVKMATSPGRRVSTALA